MIALKRTALTHRTTTKRKTSNLNSKPLVKNKFPILNFKQLKLYQLEIIHVLHAEHIQVD